MSKKFWILSIIMIVAGCDSMQGEDILMESTIEPQVFFCPRDNCNNVLVKVLDSAKDSISCALFDLDLEEVKEVLRRKSKTISVRLVIDNINSGEIKGPNVKEDTNSQLSHNKFCVVDKRIVTTGSFNPTKRGAHYNNNNLIVLHSKYLSENYLDEFEELWNGIFGEGETVKNPVIYLNDKKLENYFCPEDKCKERVIMEIMGAKQSIYFMTFSFTHEEIGDALLFSDEGVTVKGVFEKTQAGSEYSQYKRLKEFGLDVKIDNNSYNMHHKTFIIDQETVITGSYNPTGAGSHKNDENILIIHNKDVAKKYLEEFEYVWEE